jgi:phosphoribosylanthranilate isomerase
MIKATKDFLNEIDALAEARRNEILNAPDNITVKGNTYYVSADGNDENDGLTPKTPWKTLDKVSSAELSEGDGVLFDSSHGDGDTAFRNGNYKSIIAGRIGVENVADALALKPDIIDVNSSLETAPGVKSAILLAAFLARLH